MVHLGPVLDGDLGVGLQVQVPDRMVRGATHGGHDQVVAPVVDPDQRGSAQLPGLPTGGGQDDALGPVEIEAVLTIGGQIALHVVSDRFPGAGGVLEIAHGATLRAVCGMRRSQPSDEVEGPAQGGQPLVQGVASRVETDVGDPHVMPEGKAVGDLGLVAYEGGG